MSSLDVESSELATAALADPEQRRFEFDVRRCGARLPSRRIDELVLRVDAGIADRLPAWQLSPDAALPGLVARTCQVASGDFLAFAAARVPMRASGQLQVHARRPGASTRTQSGRRHAGSWTASRRSTPRDHARSGDPALTKRLRRSRTSITSEGTA